MAKFTHGQRIQHRHRQEQGKGHNRDKTDKDRQRWAHATFFFESAIAIPQLEGSTSTIAIPQLSKEMLLRNRNSAIPQSNFF
jgi:hypothetical protein